MRQNLKQTQTLHMKDIQSVHYDTRMEILAGNFKLSFAEVEFPVSGHTDTRMLRSQPGIQVSLTPKSSPHSLRTIHCTSIRKLQARSEEASPGAGSWGRLSVPLDLHIQPADAVAQLPIQWSAPEACSALVSLLSGSGESGNDGKWNAGSPTAQGPLGLQVPGR